MSNYDYEDEDDDTMVESNDLVKQLQSLKYSVQQVQQMLHVSARDLLNLKDQHLVDKPVYLAMH